mgnify:CR=1 FL=1
MIHPKPKRLIVPSLAVGSALINGYKRGFDRAFETSAEDFAWFERGDLLRSGCMLALHLEDGEVTAGFYYDREANERTPSFTVHGLYSFAQTRGAARDLIAAAILYEHDRSSQPVAVKATVRVRADGRVNPNASRFFGGLGFQPERLREQILTVSPAYRHLIPTAYRDAHGRPYLRVLDKYLPGKAALPTALGILGATV